jgi:hypothetical protein
VSIWAQKAGDGTRLNSGTLLMVRHNPPDRKTRIPTAFRIAKAQSASSTTFERTKSKLILMSVFTENDVRTGKHSASTQLRVQVNQSTGPAAKASSGL